MRSILNPTVPTAGMWEHLLVFLESLRHMKPDLSCLEELTTENFAAFQAAVKVRAKELLNMPEPTPQPDPVMLSSVQRDGYRVEKWEFYPDDYTAVPYLALIPDGASPEKPAPAVMCFLGSNHSKEFVSGEEMPEHPNYITNSYPERNQMALYMVKNGMAAFAPRYLGMTEGGADEFMHTIERAYKFCNAEDHLLINYYTDYQDPENRKMDVPVPAYGLSSADFYRKYMYVTVSDHSFRKEPALLILKRCFDME